MAVKNRRKTAGGCPFKKGQSGNPSGRPVGATNKATRDVRDFCRGLIDRPKYQSEFAARWDAGELPPQLEAMVWHYAYGKPLQAVELSTSFDPAKYLARKEEAPLD